MNCRTRFVSSLAVICLAAALNAQAKPAPKEVPAQAPVVVPQPPTPPKDEKPKEEKPKTIDELTKGFTKLEGLVTIYRQTKDASDTVYLELTEASLNKLMLLQITSGSGLGDTSAFVFHGMPLADSAIKFKMHGLGQIRIVAPNLDHRADSTEGKRGIERSFPDSILGTMEIKARQAERKSVLLDVSNFFKSDVQDLSQSVDGFGGTGYVLDSSGSRIDTVKVFPENIVIRTEYKLNRKSSMDGGPKSVPWAVSFNLSSIPETAYQPRLGDPRVGYFTVSYENLTDAKNYDNTVNMIQRWDVQKADPSLAISPAKKPIVFYIDNAVPQEYRAAVRKGLLFYNEAFEKVGIKDAIDVKQMPDDADWDIADIRYNTIRWTTGMPFAIALFRANPVTGEILNACINMDAGFASSGSSAFDNVVDPAASQTISPVLRKKFAPQLCDIMEQGREMNATGMMAAELLADGAPFDRKSYIDSYITEVVAHEFGHCLGLRHNFAASTQFSFAKLGDGAFVREHGLAASVMDYMPFNTAAVGKKDVPFYMEKIGDYDKWAVQYGYQLIPAGSPEAELPTLKQIASNDALPGHAFQSDGSADDYDPYIERFDVGAEPEEFATKLTQIGKRLRGKAGQKVKQGESYWPFTQAWFAGLNVQVNGAARALRYIGGGRLSSAFAGDPNGAMPYRAVEAAKQRQALQIMVDALFSKNSFGITQADIARLTFNPNSPSNEVSGRSRLFPIESNIASVQRSLLNRLFSSDVLSRMHANEFRGGDTLSTAELFHTVNGAVWAEVDTKQTVASLRRELQRDYLNLMINLSLGQTSGAPYDARDLAVAQLKSLRTRIVAALPSAKGEYTRPHFEECLDKIDRALKAHAVVRADQ